MIKKFLKKLGFVTRQDVLKMQDKQNMFFVTDILPEIHKHEDDKRIRREAIKFYEDGVMKMLREKGIEVIR